MKKSYYTKGVVFIVFGKKAEEDCRRTIKSIRLFEPRLPIKIDSDHKFKIWKTKFKYIKSLQPNHERGYFRSSDYYRIVDLLESTWESTLYLDNDMIIVNPNFYSRI